MKKRFPALILGLVFLICLMCGCGDDGVSSGEKRLVGLKSDELLPVDYKMNIKGKVVAIDEKYLYDGRTDISHQLYLVQSGNGVYPESRGNGCFGYNLYTGKKARIERYEIIGIVPEEKMPEFAKMTLAKIKEEKEKEDR